MSLSLSQCSQSHTHILRALLMSLGPFLVSPEPYPCPQCHIHVPRAIPTVIPVSPRPPPVSPRCPHHLQGVDAGADVAVGFLTQRQQRPRVHPHPLPEGDLRDSWVREGTAGDRDSLGTGTAQGQGSQTAQGQGQPDQGQPGLTDSLGTGTARGQGTPSPQGGYSQGSGEGTPRAQGTARAQGQPGDRDSHPSRSQGRGQPRTQGRGQPLREEDSQPLRAQPVPKEGTAPQGGDSQPPGEGTGGHRRTQGERRPLRGAVPGGRERCGGS